MRLPAVFLKSLLIWGFASALPASCAAIFFGVKAAIAMTVAIAILLTLFAILAEKFLEKTLRPSRLEIGPHPVFAIEDPSSHAFATQAVLSGEPSLWITRGALSLLTPDEIVNLLDGMRIAARQGGLRFETAITAALIRLTSRIPPGFQEILFFRQMRAKTVFIRESIRAVFWGSFVVLLELFYFPRRRGAPSITEEVLRKLEAESRRCVPRLPTALSSHAAVSPWPNAFLTLGRPCLLPERAVNPRT